MLAHPKVTDEARKVPSPLILKIGYNRLGLRTSIILWRRIAAGPPVKTVPLLSYLQVLLPTTKASSKQCDSNFKIISSQPSTTISPDALLPQLKCNPEYNTLQFL